MSTPNRIVLISDGHYEELVAGADIYPGMIASRQSAGTVIPHNVVGGGASPLRVVQEDALQGKTTADKIASGQMCPLRYPNKGDTLLFRLAAGENASIASRLMSDGFGALKVAAGPELYEIVAPSTVITNTAAETAFSNGSFAVPANTFQVGDNLRIHAKATCVAQNGANTHRVRLYIGAGPTTLLDSTALALAAADVVIFDITLTIRTITAAGTFVADGVIEYSVAGTFTTLPVTIVSTVLDSTLAQTVVIKSLASAASAGNQIRLDEFSVGLTSATMGFHAIVEAKEAIDNSLGVTTAFIRGVVV